MNCKNEFIFQGKFDFRGKSLLLSNKERNGIHFSPRTSSAIIIDIDKNGKWTSNYSDETTTTSRDDWLISIVKNEIQPEDLSYFNILKYFIIPEIEVERIFNTVRYKYLNAVLQSKLNNPQDYFNSTFNRAFQSLAGHVVYQGNAARRKNNDEFWKEAGFTKKSKDQNWEKEQDDLKLIIDLLKFIHSRNPENIYAELIAIKPGFHELCTHDDYFSNDDFAKGTSPRDRVFRILRNKQNMSCLKLDEFPREINKKSYFSYAPCSITEGPFVFRKDPSVTYVDAIRAITTKSKIKNLTEKFHILNYYSQDITTLQQLVELLEKAKFFLKYPL